MITELYIYITIKSISNTKLGLITYVGEIEIQIIC